MSSFGFTDGLYFCLLVYILQYFYNMYILVLQIRKSAMSYLSNYSQEIKGKRLLGKRKQASRIPFWTSWWLDWKTPDGKTVVRRRREVLTKRKESDVWAEAQRTREKLAVSLLQASAHVVPATRNIFQWWSHSSAFSACNFSSVKCPLTGALVFAFTVPCPCPNWYKGHTALH